jgi:hypothetical protein
VGSTCLRLALFFSFNCREYPIHKALFFVSGRGQNLSIADNLALPIVVDTECHEKFLEVLIREVSLDAALHAIESLQDLVLIKETSVPRIEGLE